MVKLIGLINDSKAIVNKKECKDFLINEGIGEKFEDNIILDSYETMYLLQEKNMEFNCENLYEKLISNNDFFISKYAVYKDFKNKGYVVKTGLKFGFDFRIYPKGKKIDESHTKYVVDVKNQDFKIKVEDISKSVRMSIGLNTKYILAIVDNELEITYYYLERFKI